MGAEDEVVSNSLKLKLPKLWICFLQKHSFSFHMLTDGLE